MLKQFVFETVPIFNPINITVNRDKYMLSFYNTVVLADNTQIKYKVTCNKKTDKVKVLFINNDNNKWYKVRKKFPNVRQDLQEQYAEWYNVYNKQIKQLIKQGI